MVADSLWKALGSRKIEHAPERLATIYERTAVFNLAGTAMHFVVFKFWLMFAGAIDLDVHSRQPSDLIRE